MMIGNDAEACCAYLQMGGEAVSQRASALREPCDQDHSVGAANQVTPTASILPLTPHYLMASLV